MNRYQFIRNARPVVESRVISESDKTKASVLTDLASILEAHNTIGEYQFTKDEKLTEMLRKADTINRYAETLPSGAVLNRCKISVNGRTSRIRCFGTKEEMPEKEYSKEEIKSLDFGFCSSDGEIVTELKAMSDGSLVKVPVIYVAIA